MHNNVSFNLFKKEKKKNQTDKEAILNSPFLNFSELERWGLFQKWLLLRQIRLLAGLPNSQWGYLKDETSPKAARNHL